jgi:cytochrome c
MNRSLFCAFCATLALATAAAAQTSRYKLGRIATSEELSKRDISVAPDGKGLPTGPGTVARGRPLYQRSCASCHGDCGRGVGPYPALVGGQGTLASKNPVLTVGGYWPYATTVWDYIRRTMPYQKPGSLTVDQTYSLTALILFMNGIVNEKTELNERNLAQVKMPNRDGFIPDPRPDVPKATHLQR